MSYSKVRGYEVEEACDGEEALEMIERTHPNVLLLDLDMPNLDGYGVVRKVRENPNDWLACLYGRHSVCDEGGPGESSGCRFRWILVEANQCGFTG